MHEIEPYFNWRDYYVASEDNLSPFYGREYSEFEFHNSIYNFLIHPQWDDFGSRTLYLKVLFVNYESGTAIIELMGEWNDCIHNDIMSLKRNVIDPLLKKGIRKYILIGENILNFHASDDCYYEEWKEDNEGGWIALINFRNHVLEEMRSASLHHFLNFGPELSEISWRTYKPNDLCLILEEMMEGKTMPALGKATRTGKGRN